MHARAEQLQTSGGSVVDATLNFDFLRESLELDWPRFEIPLSM
jgi:hypothetical protein